MPPKKSKVRRAAQLASARSHKQFGKRIAEREVATSQSDDGVATQNDNIPESSTEVAVTSAQALQEQSVQVQINSLTPNRTLLFKGSAKMHNPSKSLPTGRRLWSISAINTLISMSLSHGKTCAESHLEIIGENKQGLRTSLKIKCSICRRVFIAVNDTDDCSLPCNRAAVWAGNATGTGYTDMNLSLAALDVPLMTFKTYLKYEEKFNKEISFASQKLILANGIEERNRALELGRVDPDGQVWTEVEGDGAWSKRSYNQKGNALSGSAIIVGLLTGLPLFAGVRNKYCCICDHKREGPIPAHECGKNWTKSSSAMETDIIAEGFKKSIDMHNLRYKRFLGDGDSSVFSNIRDAYFEKDKPYTMVEKVECKNHALRCMNKNVRDLLKQTAYELAHRKILERKMNEIGKYCVYSIELAKQNNLPSLHLKDALANYLEHVFDNHEKCKSFVCHDGKLVVPTVYMKQNTAVVEATKVIPKHQNNLRNTKIWEALDKILYRLVVQAPRLIHGKTTNRSECIQGVNAKFNQGKRKDASKRFAYYRKHGETILSYQFGSGWQHPTYKSLYGVSPNPVWKKMYNIGQKDRIKGRKRVRSNRMRSGTKHTLLYKDPDYGDAHNDTDMSADDINEKLKQMIFNAKVHSVEEQWNIHLSTIGQFENQAYRDKRKNMLTASIAGEICSMRDATNNKYVIKKILGEVRFTNDAMEWGKLHEVDAIALYSKVNNCVVNKAGLFVSLEFRYLGASPDGLVGDDGIIEVKCPDSIKDKLPSEIGKDNCRFLRVVNGKYQLLRSNPYYSQIVMQLHVTNRKWCDFVVWTQGPSDGNGIPINKEGFIIQERFFRNDETTKKWTFMKEKLIKFFKEDLGPEIVDSRLTRTLPIRQPEYRRKAMAQKQDKAISEKHDKPVPEKPKRGAKRKLTYE